MEKNVRKKRRELESTTTDDNVRLVVHRSAHILMTVVSDDCSFCGSKQNRQINVREKFFLLREIEKFLVVDFGAIAEVATGCCIVCLNCDAIRFSTNDTAQEYAKSVGRDCAAGWIASALSYDVEIDL